MERLLPVFLGRHADVGLKHFVEGGHGAEPDVGGDALERDVGLRVAQQADGLVEPVAVDVLGECLARLLVEDLGEVGAVRAQQVGHFFLGQQFVPVDALVRHAMFQVLEEHVLLFVGQGRVDILLFSVIRDGWGGENVAFVHPSDGVLQLLFAAQRFLFLAHDGQVEPVLVPVEVECASGDEDEDDEHAQQELFFLLALEEFEAALLEFVFHVFAVILYAQVADDSFLVDGKEAVCFSREVAHAGQGFGIVSRVFVDDGKLVDHVVAEDAEMIPVSQGQCLLQERDCFVVLPFPAERVRIAVEQEHLGRRLVRLDRFQPFAKQLDSLARVAQLGDSHAIDGIHESLVVEAVLLHEKFSFFHVVQRLFVFSLQEVHVGRGQCAYINKVGRALLMPQLVGLERILQADRVALDIVDVGDVGQQDGAELLILAALRRVQPQEEVVLGRVGVVVQVVGIQSQPVVHGAEGRIVPRVLGIDAGLSQVVVGCRVAQHGVSLSQPDVG